MRKNSNSGAEGTVKDTVESSSEERAAPGGAAVISADAGDGGSTVSTGAVRASNSRATTASRKAPERHNPDPLFVIFEQHLLNFQDPEIDRKTFIAKVVYDYLGMLRLKNITVPKSLEQPIVEELATQVNAMLVKRIYGSSTIAEFRARHVRIRRRRTAAPKGRRIGPKSA